MSGKSARRAPPPQTGEAPPPQTAAESDKDFAESCGSGPVVGPCRAAFSRWFFNGTSGHCQKFIYGGCRGNKNNYASEDDCRSRCAAVKVQQTKKLSAVETGEFNDYCVVPPDTGICRAAFTKFYFDSEAQLCKTFTYGGCGGNNNRYSSEQECVDRCVTGSSQDHAKSSRSHWTAAFFLFLTLAAISFLLLTALIFITLRRNRQPRRSLSIRSDKEELLPDSGSLDSLPLPESPTKG